MFVVELSLSSTRKNTTSNSPVELVLFDIIHPSLPSDVFILAQSFSLSTISTTSSFFTSYNSIELINGIILSFSSSANLTFSFFVTSSVFVSLLFIVSLDVVVLLSAVMLFSVVSFLFVVFAASLFSTSIKSFLIYPVIFLYFTLYQSSSSFKISTSSPNDANSNTLESAFACSLSFAVSTTTFPVFAAKLIFIKSSVAIAIIVMNIMLFIFSFIFIFLLLILLY